MSRLACLILNGWAAARLLRHAGPTGGVFVRLFGSYDSFGRRHLTKRRWLLVQRRVNRRDVALGCPILRTEQLRHFEGRAIGFLRVVFRMLNRRVFRLSRRWRRCGFNRAIGGRRALRRSLLIRVDGRTRLRRQRSVRLWRCGCRGLLGRWLRISGVVATARRLWLLVGSLSYGWNRTA